MTLCNLRTVSSVRSSSLIISSLTTSVASPDMAFPTPRSPFSRLECDASLRSRSARSERRRQWSRLIEDIGIVCVQTSRILCTTGPLRVWMSMRSEVFNKNTAIWHSLSCCYTPSLIKTPSLKCERVSFRQKRFRRRETQC